MEHFDADPKDVLDTELNISEKLSHPHLFHDYGSTFKNKSSRFMGYMQNVLSELILDLVRRNGRNRPPFSHQDSLDILLQTAHAMVYLHEQNVVHGDLTCLNIFVSEFFISSNATKYLVKVADFGSNRSMIDSRDIEPGAATTNYAAPEVLRKRSDKSVVISHPKLIDVYSFGIIAFEVLTGVELYGDYHNDLKGKKKGIIDGTLRPPLRRECQNANFLYDDRLLSLIERCWNEDPLNRPSFLEVVDGLNNVKVRLLEPSSGLHHRQSSSLPSRHLVGLERIGMASLKHLLDKGLAGIGLASMEPSDINARSAKPEISFELQSRDLPSTRLLGKGLAGIGYETTWKGARYARKDFFGVQKDIFLKEASRLVGLRDHKNIVKTYGWTADKRSCSLVLEYMDDDLVSLLQKTRNSNKVLSMQSSTSPFDLLEALGMMVQIAAGVAYLHGEKLVHGDLKTKNILVSRKKGGELSSTVVKVTDYGLVQTKRKSEFIVSRQVRKLDMVRWKAPECWRKQFMRKLNSEDETSSESESESASGVSFTPPVVNVVDEFAADVYSFAMICSELLTGDTPYPHMKWKELGHKILGGSRPILPYTICPELRGLLVSCWGESALRPSCAVVCYELTLIKQSLTTVTARVGQGISSELQSRDLPSTRLLGKGLAGIGYETTWNGGRYARKDFFGVQKDTFLEEAPRLVGLRDHKNIVKTYGWTTDKRSCSLVLEYMDDDLVSLLQKTRNSNKVLSMQSSTSPFDLREALGMMVQIAAGVAYLHEEKLVHGGLKTKNILVSRKKGGELSSTVVKVTDYGLVQTKRKSEFIVSRQVRKLDMVRWKAPECWRKQFMRKLNSEDETSSESESESASGVSFTPPVVNVVDEFAADVYSFAMICSELLTGDTPYPHMKWKELGHKILGGLRPNLPITCHPMLKDLLMSCWGDNPAKRPSFAIICSELTSIQQSIAIAIGKQPQEVAMPFVARPPAHDRVEMGRLTEESTASSSSRMPSTSTSASPGPTSSMEPISQVSKALGEVKFRKEIVEANYERLRVETPWDDSPVSSMCDGSGSGAREEVPLEAKHKIFLSHSGAQKTFVEQLCVDLERWDRHPFFDKRRDNLPIGEHFPNRIFEAIRQCQVGVLILSKEFFTRTKWPMLELEAMVECKKQNSELVIMPVFLGISREQCRNHDRWESRWLEMKQVDCRINVEKWKEALAIFGPTNGLIYNEALGEVKFREEIVEAICERVRPETQWDDSHVQGRSRLCQVIHEKVKRTQVSEVYGFRVLGLYGVGGLGKTTMCKALCNNYYKEFKGRVAHVELESDVEVELMRRVLKKLTDTRFEVLARFDKGKCTMHLKYKVRQHDVFLVIDNVSDTSEAYEQTRVYLRAGFTKRSVVIVSARSKEVLKVVGVAKEDCIEMPKLDASEARALFLDRVLGVPDKINANDEVHIMRCVELCRFRNVEKTAFDYVPLALKVLGEQFGAFGYDPKLWVERMQHTLDDGMNPVFKILRRSFDALRKEDQLLFMDAVLYFPGECASVNLDINIFEWLSMVHGEFVERVKLRLQGLQRKSIIEVFGERIGVHDLWRKFAKEETKAGGLEYRSWVYVTEDEKCGFNDVEPSEQSGYRWGNLRRLCFTVKSSKGIYVNMTMLTKLQYFSNVTVLHLTGLLDGVEVLDVTPLRSLRSLLLVLPKFGYEENRVFSSIELRGLKSLKRLGLLVWTDNYIPSACMMDIAHLTSLQFLSLSCKHGDHLPDLSYLTSLQVVQFNTGGRINKISGLNKLIKLKRLKLRFESECTICACYGICDLVALEELEIEGRVDLEEDFNLRKLTNLKRLSMPDCESIKEISGLDDLVELK